MSTLNEANSNEDYVQKAFKSRFLNLMTEYGFKALLADAKNSDLLIQFLNDALNGEKKISHIKLLGKEANGTTILNRTGSLDILCEDQDGEEFTIELQLVRQSFFKDQSVFDITSHILENAPVGVMVDENSNYQQKPVYFIGLLDFEIDNSSSQTYRRVIKLCDVHEETVFYDKLTCIYIELPAFARLDMWNKNKKLTNLEKWLCLFKNLHTMLEVPDFIEEGFETTVTRIKQIAETRNMSPEQRKIYEKSLWEKWDENGIREAGIEEGIRRMQEKTKQAEEEANKIKEEAEKAQRRTVINLLKLGNLSVSQIAQALSVDEAIVMKIKELNQSDAGCMSNTNTELS